SRQFAATQNVIADGKLAIGEKNVDSLIHALVAAANQRHTLQSGQLLGHALVKALALGGKQHHRFPGDSGQARFPGRDRLCFQTLKDRFRLQNHALAAAEGTVVHSAVAVVGEVAQVNHLDLHQTSLAGAPKDAMLQRPAKEVGKNGYDLELHEDQFPSFEFQAANRSEA